MSKKDTPGDAHRIIGPLQVDTVDLLPGHVIIAGVHDVGDPEEPAITTIHSKANRLLMGWQKRMLRLYPRGRFTAVWSLDGHERRDADTNENEEDDGHDMTRMVFTTFADVTADEEVAWRRVMDKPLWTLKIHKKVLTPRRSWIIGVDDTADRGFMPLDNTRAQRVLGRWLMKMKLQHPSGCITSVSSLDDVLDPYRIIYNTND